MTEDSTPYCLPAERMPPTDDRRISIALTHSEWIELKIALASEIERRSQDGTYSPPRLEELKQLLGQLREEID